MAQLPNDLVELKNMLLADLPSGQIIQATSDDTLMNCLCQFTRCSPVHNQWLSIYSNRVYCPSKKDNYRCPMVQLSNCMPLQARTVANSNRACRSTVVPASRQRAVIHRHMLCSRRGVVSELRGASQIGQTPGEQP